MVGGRKVKVDHACTRCSVQGEAGENKMNEYGSSSHYACHAVLDQYPTILPFQSQSPRALVVLLGLPNPLHLLLAVPWGPLGGVLIVGKKHSR